MIVMCDAAPSVTPRDHAAILQAVQDHSVITWYHKVMLWDLDGRRSREDLACERW